MNFEQDDPFFIRPDHLQAPETALRRDPSFVGTVNGIESNLVDDEADPTAFYLDDVEEINTGDGTVGQSATGLNGNKAKPTGGLGTDKKKQLDREDECLAKMKSSQVFSGNQSLVDDIAATLHGKFCIIIQP